MTPMAVGGRESGISHLGASAARTRAAGDPESAT